MSVEATLRTMEEARVEMAALLGLDDALARTAWHVDGDGRLGLQVRFCVPEVLRRVRVLWRASAARPAYGEQAKETLKQFVENGAMRWGDCGHRYYHR